MENINVIVGPCYKANKKWFFNLVINGTTHVMSYRRSYSAKFAHALEDWYVKAQTISPNVKKFYQNDQLFTMAGSHELSLLAD